MFLLDMCNPLGQIVANSLYRKYIEYLMVLSIPGKKNNSSNSSQNLIDSMSLKDMCIVLQKRGQGCSYKRCSYLMKVLYILDKSDHMTSMKEGLNSNKSL